MFKDVLDKLTCVDPDCKHLHDAEVYLHSRCHKEMPHLVIKVGCTVKAQCPRCNQIAVAFNFKEEKLIHASWKDGIFLCQQCHPDQGIWTAYRAGSGIVRAVCAVCDGEVAQFTVPGEKADTIEVRFAPTNSRAVAAEWLGAIPVSKTVARLTNTPFFTAECTCGDLVEFDQNRHVNRVLERCGRPRLARYKFDSAKPYAFISLCQQLRAYLYENSLILDLGAHQPGPVALHVPTAITDSRLEEICSKAPVPITLLPPGTTP